MVVIKQVELVTKTRPLDVIQNTVYSTCMWQICPICMLTATYQCSREAGELQLQKSTENTAYSLNLPFTAY